MFQENSQVLWNKHYSGSYYKIGIGCNKGYSAALPGQFVMLRAGRCAPQSALPQLLRRPFSIHRLIFSGEALQGIELLYKVVGPCTQHLSECKKGDIIDVLGPLGNSFPIPDESRRIFMAAGGVGVAPLVFLADILQKKKADLGRVAVFIGGRTRDDILCRNDFSDSGMSVHVTTEDGKAGEKGLITVPFESAIRQQPPDIIYACGPSGMLRAVAEIAEKYAVPCRISVETLMACGMGACLGCALKMKNNEDRYLHACADGPVFDAASLVL
jgi:dihydroorotate dehydrogenase electron transfer subunit